MSGKKRVVEELWRDFFSKTSQWLDYRTDKITPRCPDFRHKHTGKSLWLADSRNPPWVHTELAAIPSGTVRKGAFVWNQKLSGYVKSRQYMKTLEIFHQMQQEGIDPDSWTFVPVLNSCAGLGALEKGRSVHKQILQVGCESDVFVGSCLVNMYAKCGSIEDAGRVFKQMPARDVVTWNVMIGAYVKSGQGLKALELVRSMQQEGYEPTSVTFVGALNACASVGALEQGRCIHEEIIRKGCESNFLVGSSLVDMYAKCGSMEDAERVFKKMSLRDVVTWNVMIGAYVKSGQGFKALELFQCMQQEGYEPDSVTFVGALNACASIVALEQGRCVHEQIIRKGCESDVIVGSSLIDMYAKCGSMEDAGRVFKKMRVRDVVTWTTMIWGYAMHGNAEEAIELFEKMDKEGVEINDVTLTCLLSACSHGGLVNEGLAYFKSMSSRFNILPTTEHYTCIVDLLGRAGQLESAEEFAKSIPWKSSACAWKCLLAACRIHGDVEIADRATKWCLEFETANS